MIRFISVMCLAAAVQVFSYPASAQSLTRASRWEGSVRGCLANSTMAEIQKYGSKLPRLCTCLANFLVKTCVPSDATTTDAYKVCASKYSETQMMTAVDPCLKAGTEPDKNPYAK